MAGRLRIAFGLVLIAPGAFFIWLGVDVGSRAFAAHPDSGPALYLAFGGAYIALGVVCAVASLVLFRWRSR